MSEGEQGYRPWTYVNRDLVKEWMKVGLHFRQLDLSSSDVDDDVVPLLTQIGTFLEVLNLARTKVTDEGLKRVGDGLPNLRHLDISFTKVNGEGLVASWLPAPEETDPNPRSHSGEEQEGRARNKTGVTTERRGRERKRNANEEKKEKKKEREHSERKRKLGLVAAKHSLRNSTRETASKQAKRREDATLPPSNPFALLADIPGEEQEEEEEEFLGEEEPQEETTEDEQQPPASSSSSQPKEEQEKENKQAGRNDTRVPPSSAFPKLETLCIQGTCIGQRKLLYMHHFAPSLRELRISVGLGGNSISLKLLARAFPLLERLVLCGHLIFRDPHHISSDHFAHGEKVPLLHPASLYHVAWFKELRELILLGVAFANISEEPSPNKKTTKSKSKYSYSTYEEKGDTPERKEDIHARKVQDLNSLLGSDTISYSLTSNQPGWRCGAAEEVSILTLDHGTYHYPSFMRRTNEPCSDFLQPMVAGLRQCRHFRRLHLDISLWGSHWGNAQFRWYDLSALDGLWYDMDRREEAIQAQKEECERKAVEIKAQKERLAALLDKMDKECCTSKIDAEREARKAWLQSKIERELIVCKEKTDEAKIERERWAKEGGDSLFSLFEEFDAEDDVKAGVRYEYEEVVTVEEYWEEVTDDEEDDDDWEPPEAGMGSLFGGDDDDEEQIEAPPARLPKEKKKKKVKRTKKVTKWRRKAPHSLSTPFHVNPAQRRKEVEIEEEELTGAMGSLFGDDDDDTIVTTKKYKPEEVKKYEEEEEAFVMGSLFGEDEEAEECTTTEKSNRKKEEESEEEAFSTGMGSLLFGEEEETPSIPEHTKDQEKEKEKEQEKEKEIVPEDPDMVGPEEFGFSYHADDLCTTSANKIRRLRNKVSRKVKEFETRMVLLADQKQILQNEADAIQAQLIQLELQGADSLSELERREKEHAGLDREMLPWLSLGEGLGWHRNNTLVTIQSRALKNVRILGVHHPAVLESIDWMAFSQLETLLVCFKDSQKNKENSKVPTTLLQLSPLLSSSETPKIRHLHVSPQVILSLRANHHHPIDDSLASSTKKQGVWSARCVAIDDVTDFYSALDAANDVSAAEHTCAIKDRTMEVWPVCGMCMGDGMGYMPASSSINTCRLSYSPTWKPETKGLFPRHIILPPPVKSI